MFEVGIVARFEAAHSLRGDFGPATRKHGHTYRVEVTVRGETLRPDGTLLDIVVLQEAVQHVLQSMHYRDLDELPAFAERNSTAEGVAQHIASNVRPRLTGKGLADLAVRVWESPEAFAGYQVDLSQ